MACSIPGCGKLATSRGWCPKHYSGWKRHGDPLYRRPGEIRDGKRICYGCKEDRSLGDYSPGNRKCKTCVAAARREKRATGAFLVAKRPMGCQSCGATFAGDGRNSHYCSPECAQSGKRQWDRANPGSPEARSLAQKKWRDTHPERNWQKAAAYRARKKVATAERVDRDVIFDRDEWRCQICFEPIDRTLRRPDPLSPSIDHRVPLARGGTHDLANCQAAHLKCNVAKGARLEADRLAV